MLRYVQFFFAVPIFYIPTFAFLIWGSWLVVRDSRKLPDSVVLGVTSWSQRLGLLCLSLAIPVSMAVMVSMLRTTRYPAWVDAYFTSWVFPASLVLSPWAAWMGSQNQGGLAQTRFALNIGALANGLLLSVLFCLALLTL